jgi:hypothetical protein
VLLFDFIWENILKTGKRDGFFAEMKKTAIKRSLRPEHHICTSQYAIAYVYL